MSSCQQSFKAEGNPFVANKISENNKVVSQFASAYDLQDKDCFIDVQTVNEAFRRSKIVYRPFEAYQQFSFEVERIVPELDYFIIRVKLAHFSLTVSFARFSEQNSISADIYGNYGSISFIELQKKTFCLKTISFKSQDEFQILFPSVVKEWTILKICSALECAPYLPKVLGFDLLIFENCVQYATEKGEGIAELSLQESKELRQQLSLMHAFKIVHLDIKPENIVFSQHFGKPVFIDFGFSEIISQQFGYKTLITFKGTPNFCSPQMLAIMLQGKGFIDLYYNDTYSLNLTQAFNLKRNMLVQYEQQKSKIRCFNIRETVTASVTSYTIYPFQYYYLQSDYLKAKQALRICLNLSIDNAKNVLKFIKIVARFAFIRQIFQNDLRSYSFMTEYRQIKEHLRQNVGKLFYKINQKKSVQENQRQNVKFRLQSFCADAALTHNYKDYVNILLCLKKLEDKHAINFIAMCFKCIRFDVSNLEIHDKKQLAIKMNILLLNYLHRDIKQFFVQEIEEKNLTVDSGKEDLKPIKVLLILIFEFCLTQKHIQTKWIKRYIFDICQQMIFVGICFLQYIDKFEEYVGENFTLPKDQVLAMFEYARLGDTASIIDTSPTDDIEMIQHKLDSLFQQNLNKRANIPTQQINSQDRQIFEILDILQNNKDNQSRYQFINQEKRIRQVEDYQIRKYLLLCLTKKKINYYIEIMCPEQLFKTSQFIKRSSDLQNLDFLTLSILIIKILQGLYNKEGARAYYKYIQNIISCSTIFESLKFKQKKQLAKTDSENIQTKIRNIINRHQHSLRFQLFVGDIFSLLILIEAKKIPLDTNIHHQLVNLYDLYESYNKEEAQIKVMKINPTTIQQFINIYFYIKIQFFFFKLSEKTQYLFIKKLSLAQQNFHQLVTQQEILSNIQQRSKLIICTFILNFYELYYHIHIRNYQSCFDCINQLQTLLKSLKLNSLLLENIRLEIDLSVQWKRMQLIQKAVIKLYSFSCQNDLRYLYLLPLNNNQFYVTLVGFQASNPELFYELLKWLTTFLHEHPLQQYIQSFLFTLDKFLALNHENGYALHYCKFLGHNGQHKIQQNPYLLIFYSYSLLNEDAESQLKLFKKILANCDRLSYYTKKKILQKSFDVYFRCLKSSNRQQALFVFRRIKEYIVQTKKKKIIKQIVKIRSRNSNLIAKQKRYIEYLI